MTLRILYLSQYFPPEVGATQSRAFDMVNYLVEQGLKVTVITEFPNHPSGVIPSRYSGKFYERETVNNIDIIRVWVKPSRKKNFVNRIIFYLTYCVNAILAGLVLKEKYDLILATSPPLFTALSGLILHWTKRAKYIVEIRDLWPESAISLGELNNKIAIKCAKKLEELCYLHADNIIVVTNGIQTRLQADGVSAQKITLIENGADTDKFHFLSDIRNKIRLDQNWQDKFVVLYAGTLGVAQGLELVIKAARELSERPDIHFLFIGEGPVKSYLMLLTKNWKLRNITFMAEIPRDLIPSYLSAADIALVPLREIELFQGVVPSKLFDAWACECPVILGVDGEARQLLESCQGGFFVIPENVDSLVTTLLSAVQNIQTLPEMGKRGRIFTVENFSRQAQAQKLITIIKMAVQE